MAIPHKSLTAKCSSLRKKKQNHALSSADEYYVRFYGVKTVGLQETAKFKNLQNKIAKNPKNSIIGEKNFFQ